MENTLAHTLIKTNKDAIQKETSNIIAKIVREHGGGRNEIYSV